PPRFRRQAVSVLARQGRTLCELRPDLQQAHEPHRGVGEGKWCRIPPLPLPSLASPACGRLAQERPRHLFATGPPRAHVDQDDRDVSRLSDTRGNSGCKIRGGSFARIRLDRNGAKAMKIGVLVPVLVALSAPAYAVGTSTITKIAGLDLIQH